MNNCIKQTLDLHEIHKAIMIAEQQPIVCERNIFRVSMSRDTLCFIKGDVEKTLMSPCVEKIIREASRIEKERPTVCGVRIIIDDSLTLGEFEILRRM